jgi:acetylornithine deacetylase/succinyl-diaminopimelate desuccinylase-like protein
MIDARTHDLAAHTTRFWQRHALPLLKSYIRIPNISPAFDPEWERRGHMNEAIELVRRWCAQRPLGQVEVRSAEPEGRTPALLIRVRGAAPGSVLLYGHLDKQPELTGWSEGLGAWKPVVRGDRLYGRGGADDGFAVCAALGALEALQQAGAPYPTCCILLECCEESGSADLPYYLEEFAGAIGEPELVVALDSEAGNYDQLWITTSLRGTLIGTLKVDILTEGVHSGAAGGMVPSSFRIARQLLDRIENPESGALTELFAVPIPEPRRAEAAATAAVLGSSIIDKFPWVDGARPVSPDGATLLLNNAWRPCLSVTGAAGLPVLEAASSTQRPFTALKLSVRIPPTLDANLATQRMKSELERDAPYGARVQFDVEVASTGWDAPMMPEWLRQSVQRASQQHFGLPAQSIGTGGTIPFVEMLEARFPRAAFLVTGVLGPHSNAHGPNEFLHLTTVQRLTACLASILGDTAARHCP